MGEHESKPSGKRFRPGTPIKYVHKRFRKDSTKEDLASILRSTFTTTRVKSQRKTHSKKYLHLQRYKQIVQALEEEIRQREEQQKQEKKRHEKKRSEFQEFNLISPAMTVQEEQHLATLSLDQFEFNLNSEADLNNLDDEFEDLMKQIDKVSDNSQILIQEATQHPGCGNFFSFVNCDNI